MKAKDARNLSATELTGRRLELTRELFALRGAVRSGREKNTAKLRQLRRDIARLATLEKQATLT